MDSGLFSYKWDWSYLRLTSLSFTRLLPGLFLLYLLNISQLSRLLQLSELFGLGFSEIGSPAPRILHVLNPTFLTVIFGPWEIDYKHLLRLISLAFPCSHSITFLSDNSSLQGRRAHHLISTIPSNHFRSQPWLQSNPTPFSTLLISQNGRSRRRPPAQESHQISQRLQNL